ncbi:hypothetical protein EV363DRAFT_1168306, partial [Boletus edulis]
EEIEIRPGQVLRLLGRARYVRFILNPSSRHLYDEPWSVGEVRQLVGHVNACFCDMVPWRRGVCKQAPKTRGDGACALIYISEGQRVYKARRPTNHNFDR